MQEKYAEALAALERLKAGNRSYIGAERGGGDISPERRAKTSIEGQHPYAVIVGCSDSRVIPEHIFSAGIGELFVIRVAGNVVDNIQLGSIEYAVEHLGCSLVLVLGHTGCGAVGAALEEHGGYVKYITDEIKCAIQKERDLVKASVKNVEHSVSKIRAQFMGKEGVLVTGALYHTQSGVVDFDIGS